VLAKSKKNMLGPSPSTHKAVTGLQDFVYMLLLQKGKPTRLFKMQRIPQYTLYIIKEQTLKELL
jgi:hypothetical protein